MARIFSTLKPPPYKIFRNFVVLKFYTMLAYPNYSALKINCQRNIQELPKRIAPDGRRRQYFGITETGRDYFRRIWMVYKAFTSGVDQLVTSVLPTEKGGANQ